jgi:hypothetical protein
VSRLESGIENIQQLITNLVQTQPNNNTIKQLQEAVESHVNDLKTLLSDFETPEEKERKRSLVVIGLPEPTHDRPSEFAKADNETATSMLDTLGIRATPSAVYRMGRDNVNRKGPRLMKIVLPASHFQRQALSSLREKRQALRALPGFQRAFIRPSLSPAELEQDRLLRDRLKETRAKNPGVRIWIRKGQLVADGQDVGDLN